MAPVMEPGGYFKVELGGLIWFILFYSPALNPWDRRMTVTTDMLVRYLVRDVLELCLMSFQQQLTRDAYLFIFKWLNGYCTRLLLAD